VIIPTTGRNHHPEMSRFIRRYPGDIIVSPAAVRRKHIRRRQPTIAAKLRHRRGANRGQEHLAAGRVRIMLLFNKGKD
jgi:hypothetical protein